MRAQLCGGVLLGMLACSGSATAQEPFLGEIRPFTFNFCPKGWAETNGQILSISQNTALFALLGTTYGGNGQTTFALPDLRARSLVSAGALGGTGTAVALGEQGGAESTTLTAAMLPAHSHAATTSVTVTSTLRGTTATATTNVPTAAALAVPPPISTKKNETVAPLIYVPASPNAAMATGSVLSEATATTTVGNAGASSPTAVPTRSPYLAVTFCIALTGIFPPRN